MFKVKHFKDEKDKIVDHFSNSHSVRLYGTPCRALCYLHSVETGSASRFPQGGRPGASQVRRAARRRAEQGPFQGCKASVPGRVGSGAAVWRSTRLEGLVGTIMDCSLYPKINGKSIDTFNGKEIR